MLLKKSLVMGLDDKKELVTHNALLKKHEKENDDARAALKKDLKKGDSVESWFCSRDAAKHFKHEWRDHVAEVSFAFLYLFCFLLLTLLICSLLIS
jgi:hypothetical protein